MTGVGANKRGETFTRLIGHLSKEIHQLTREISLLEGRLIELEAILPADGGEAPRLWQELCTARQRLLDAEVDLVELERLVLEDSR